MTLKVLTALNHGVFASGFAEICRAELWRPLLCLEIDIDEAKPVRKTVAPLKIVHEAPVKVALHGHPLRGRPVKMSKVVTKEHDSVRIIDDPIAGHFVACATPVLGDVDFLCIP